VSNLKAVSCGIVLLFFIYSIPLHAQTEEQFSYHQFFISPIAEVNMHGWDISYGGGLSIGGGAGVSIGTNVYYFIDSNDINILEMTVFMRFFLLGSNANYGPFAQLIGGMVLYARDNLISIPADIGTMSIGAGFGWRFLLGNRWFVEPAVRAGYPYLIGMGVSTGILF